MYGNEHVTVPVRYTICLCLTSCISILLILWEVLYHHLLSVCSCRNFTYVYNGIKDLVVRKESEEQCNDVNKFVLVLTKGERLDSNFHRDVDKPELTQLDKFKEDQGSEERFANNSTHADQKTTWQLRSLPEPSRDKNRLEDACLDGVSNKVICEHEIAVSENNECSKSHSEIVIAVENNFPVPNDNACMQSECENHGASQLITQQIPELDSSDGTLVQDNLETPVLSNTQGNKVADSACPNPPNTCPQLTVRCESGKICGGIENPKPKCFRRVAGDTTPKEGSTRQNNTHSWRQREQLEKVCTGTYIYWS